MSPRETLRRIARWEQRIHCAVDSEIGLAMLYREGKELPL
jgi:hypothetical protein